MAGDGLQHRRAGELPLHRAALHIQGIQGEYIMMHQGIVPGRAGTVITEILAAHLLVTLEPVGVIIDPLAGAVPFGSEYISGNEVMFSDPVFGKYRFR